MTQYTLVRSRRKTLALTVTRAGEVVVRAPYAVSDEQIARFVAQHSEWIAKRLACREEQPRFCLDDGETLVLFGEEYAISEGRARVAGGVLYLPRDNRERALVSLLKRLSRAYMTELTDRIAVRYGFTFSGVRVSSARGRWGSCNRGGRIAYTFRIAFLPPALSEYVAVHELCHTVHFNHGAAFWNAVEDILPDCRGRRRRLKSYAWAMNIL